MIERKTNKEAVLFVNVITAFLTTFMGSAVNVALGHISKEFQMTEIGLSWVATAYLLASAMFLVPFGRLADIIGRKRIFLTGVIVYSLASLLISVSQSQEFMIAFRCLQGLGGSMVFGTGSAMLTSVYPPNERGKAFGINVAAVYLGLSLGPMIGGLLTEYLGWRSIFWLNVPLGLIIIIVTLIKIKDEWADAKGEKFDLAGSAIYSISLVMLMLGFSFLPKFYAYIMLGCGFMGLILFIKIELIVEKPVLDISLFTKNKVFAYSNLAALISYSATFSVIFILSRYLQAVKDLNPKQVGFIITAQPIVQVIISPIAGKMSDKTEPRIIASIGMAFTVVGLTLLA